MPDLPSDIGLPAAVGLDDLLAGAEEAVISVAAANQELAAETTRLARRLRPLVAGRRIVVAQRDGEGPVDEGIYFHEGGNILDTWYAVESEKRGEPSLRRLAHHEWWRHGGVPPDRLKIAVDQWNLEHPLDDSRWYGGAEAFRAELPQLLDGIEMALKKDIARYTRAIEMNPQHTSAVYPELPAATSTGAEDLHPGEYESLAEPVWARILELERLAHRRDVLAELIVDASTNLAQHIRAHHPKLLAALPFVVKEHTATYELLPEVLRRRLPMPRVVRDSLTLPAVVSTVKVESEVLMLRERLCDVPVERAPRRDPDGRALRHGWNVDASHGATFIEVVGGALIDATQRAQTVAARRAPPFALEA